MVIGDAYLGRLLLGQYETVCSGFAWAQTTSPSLTMNFAEGWVMDQQPVDAEVYGSLAADSQQVVQTGYLPAGQMTFTTGGMSSGQTQWALVEIGYTQSDVIRTGDPTDGVLPYVNVDNPSQPLSGPNNSGAAQPTERASLAVMQIKYGAPSMSSPVPPSADAGFIPLAMIQLSFGQTAITTGQLVLAGPAAYGGYPHAPYFPGVTGTIPNAPGGSHHGGVAGQAAQIDVTTEINGIIPLPNLPVTNQNPATIGGHVIVPGEIPIMTQLDVSPTGVLAGNQSDLAFNRTTGQAFICTASGNAGSAVWAGIGAGGLAQYENASFTILPGNFTYLCDTSGSGWTQTLPAASTMGQTGVSFKNIGTNPLILQPFSGERFENLAPNATITLQPNDKITLEPQSGYGFWVCG